MLTFSFSRNYWMGLNMKNGDYLWEDGGSGDGVNTIFTEILKYRYQEGCGYISSGATISMTQCTVREGFICEHPNGKETVITIDCDQHIVFNDYQTDKSVRA